MPKTSTCQKRTLARKQHMSNSSTCQKKAPFKNGTCHEPNRPSNNVCDNTNALSSVQYTYRSTIGVHFDKIITEQSISLSRSLCRTPEGSNNRITRNGGQTERLTSICGNSCPTASKKGNSMQLMKPIWDDVFVALSRSIHEDTGRPSSFSMSPCKHSSQWS